ANPAKIKSRTDRRVPLLARPAVPPFDCSLNNTIGVLCPNPTKHADFFARRPIPHQPAAPARENRSRDPQSRIGSVQKPLSPLGGGWRAQQGGGGDPAPNSAPALSPPQGNSQCRCAIAHPTSLRMISPRR